MHDDEGLAHLGDGWHDDADNGFSSSSPPSPPSPSVKPPLTCYLTQSLIGCGLFYGIGPGWAGEVGPTLFPLIALVVFALQVLGCRWWLQRYRFGPVEWLWRSMTYGTRQLMLQQQTTAPVAAAAR